MADDKLNAGTKDNTPPEAPAPAGKVIDLSSIQVATDHDGKESTAPDVTAKPPEAVPDQNRRGRPPKEQAGVSARKKEKAAEPRTGRPSKVDKAAREEAPPAVRDKVSRGKKADKGKETGSGGAPVSKTAQAVKPGKAAPVKEAAVPPPEINLPPTPDVPPRPVEEGKIVYLKMAELHPFHTFREHPYKVQDDILNAKNVEDTKSFMSRQKDTYKTPYDRHPKDHKRQCVFAGSSNSLDFLPMDRSGNRRFLPILCKSDEAEVHILDDEKASREYIDQMWAEAMVIYRSGDFQLKLPKKIEEELREYQKQFMQEDTKKELILDYLEHCQANMVCSRQLYAEALGNDGNPAQWEIREINDIMNNCSDWIAFSNPRHFPEPYRRQKGWEKPDNKGRDFQPITKEQMEQLSLPAEWMQ